MCPVNSMRKPLTFSRMKYNQIMRRVVTSYKQVNEIMILVRMPFMQSDLRKRDFRMICDSVAARQTLSN